jgi:hypothetical protein
VINYEQKDEYIRVKWHKKELGRIYRENNHWHYRPRGCGWKIRGEEFASLTALKRDIEGEE